jgi:hypothetical protein
MPWTRDPLEARRAERERLVALARDHVTRLASDLDVVAAIVAGSVARGDFNVWSDVDLVIVSDDLPADPRERFDRLTAHRPGRVEVHGYTTEQFAAAVRRGDALAREAADVGIVLAGALPP